MVGQIAVEHREVSLKAKPPEMLAVSLKGTVPVLVLADGRVLDESLDIMYWALEQNDPEGWLDPGDSMDALIAINDGPFKHHLDRAKYPGRYGPDDQDHFAEAVKILVNWEERLGEASFLCGQKASLADHALFPFVRQFARIDTARWNGLPFPKLHHWLNRFADSECFATVMTRHMLWPSPIAIAAQTPH